MPPPPPPKTAAPLPPKAKAPPPPPPAANKNSTYDLGKNAASAAGSAAKMALLSFGSKIKKDMQSFTKSELENAGVDTTKPMITKRNPVKTKKLSTTTKNKKVKKVNNNTNKNNWKTKRAPSPKKMNKNKNLKPSLVKNKKKSPPLQSKQAPPSKLNNPYKPPPKKLTFTTPWNKRDGTDSKKMAENKSKSKGSTGSFGEGPSIFNLTDVNTKIAKPEDYNEIEFKAVDPMELRRKQKITGASKYARTTNMVVNKPTSGSNLGNNNNNNINRDKKKVKPALPSSLPPKQGVLEVMPRKQENGWIYNIGGMFAVSYKENIKQIQDRNIFVGSPVIFESVDKSAKNLRLRKKLDVNVVKECMTKKGNKTKYDSKYYIYDTGFEFDGNLSMNAFEIPKDCDPQQIAIKSEKIINAFMNTNGGILYIGIDNQWNIKGVKANDIDLDGIKQCVIQIVSKFKPKLDNSDLKKLKFKTIAILTKEGHLKKELVVIKIMVPGPFKNHNNDKIIFRTSKGDKFKKQLNYIIKVVM